LYGGYNNGLSILVIYSTKKSHNMIIVTKFPIIIIKNKLGPVRVYHSVNDLKRCKYNI